MTQKNIKMFINEVSYKPLKKNYNTNKQTCTVLMTFGLLTYLDLKDYGPENNRRYRYSLVIIDNLSKFGWTKPLKNKIAQIIKDSFEKVSISSKRSPNLIESDRGKQFHSNIFQDFLKKQ